MAAVKILYDSLCPVCSREVRWLKRFDAKANLDCIDIAAADFEPGVYGLTIAQCVGSLHGIGANGERFEGMDTVRAMYAAVGLGPLMAWTKWPVLAPVFDVLYRLFARLRPRLSSFKGTAASGCETDRCKI